MSTAVGDEGGFAPDLPSSEEAIERVLEAAERAGHARARSRSRSTRRRASSTPTARTRSRAARKRPPTLPDYWAGLVERFPIVSIEDGPRRTTGRPGRRSRSGSATNVQLVGDDLFVTNVERLQRGIDECVANAILIKVNQIGTLTETLDAIALARSAGYGVVMSHRSGETEDTTIADLAVATNAGQIKTGAPSRTRPRREVQPAPPDRGGARRRGGLSRLGRVRPSLSVV